MVGAPQCSPRHQVQAFGSGQRRRRGSLNSSKSLFGLKILQKKPGFGDTGHWHTGYAAMRTNVMRILRIGNGYWGDLLFSNVFAWEGEVFWIEPGGGCP
jgi:hypothetical protein